MSIAVDRSMTAIGQFYVFKQPLAANVGLGGCEPPQPVPASIKKRPGLITWAVFAFVVSRAAIFFSAQAFEFIDLKKRPGLARPLFGDKPKSRHPERKSKGEVATGR